MQLNNGDMIRDGDNMFSIFCILGNVIYAQQDQSVDGTVAYNIEEILKYYRKLEIVEKWLAG